MAASLFLATFCGASFGFWHLTHVVEDLVKSSAVESAAQYSEMLEVVGDIYSEDIVKVTGSHGIEATADYAAESGTIPLPATLLTVLLERDLAA